MNAKTSDENPEGRTRVSGTHSSLGEQLREAREARGLSLREISDQTRISPRYLEAIEANDYKRLPGGIFNRSFIKAYAKAVGFDEDEAVQAYARTAREQGDPAPGDLPTSRQPSRLYTDGASTRSPFVTTLLSVLILAILTLGAYAGLHWYRRNVENRAGRPPTATTNAGVGNQINTAQNNAPHASAAPETATPVSGLNVQVKARGDDVWIRTRVDAEQSTNGTLPAEQVKTFAPANSLSLQFSKSKAASLEVTINGRPATVPTEANGKPLVEMLITKDNYEQLLRRP